MPIASDFLVKGEIERIWTEMKRMSNMGGILEVLGKIHFDHLTFKIKQIIRIQCFIFFKFNFGTKVYFCYFSH
jgi:hypothetical protein